MNAINAMPRTPTTISIACPWCDEPLAVEDAFAASAVRCDACATSIDIAGRAPERSAGVDPARAPERSAGLDLAVAVAA